MRLLRGVGAGLPDLVSAGLLYVAWSEPQRFGYDWFRAAAFTMLLEFFVIHAGGFMAATVVDPEASTRTRLLRLLGWTTGYTAFISLFALGFNAGWMVWAFLWFCFSKVQATWTLAPLERDRTHAIVSWALSVVVFLGSIFLTLEYPVPELGATAEVRAQTGFDKGGGVWETEPHRALAGGVLYFAIMGLLRPPLAWAFRSR